MAPLFLFRHRPALLVCLTLGGLLRALPTPAGPPVAAAPTARPIVLQHTVPSDILKALRWNQSTQRFESAAPIRIEGVTRISAQPADNSLSVVATPAGLAKVREIITLLDIAPRHVQIKFALAHATDADLKASGIPFDLAPAPGPEDADTVSSHAKPTFLHSAAGKAVALFLQMLTKQGAVTQMPIVSTSNNVAASISVSTQFPSQVVSSVTFAATPRVNSDNSVTLALHPVVADVAAKREVKTLRTVGSGGTMALVMPPASPNAGGDNLLLFVTPTILSDENGSPAVPKK